MSKPIVPVVLVLMSVLLSIFWFSDRTELEKITPDSSSFEEKASGVAKAAAKTEPLSKPVSRSFAQKSEVVLSKLQNEANADDSEADDRLDLETQAKIDRIKDSTSTLSQRLKSPILTGEAGEPEEETFEVEEDTETQEREALVEEYQQTLQEAYDYAVSVGDDLLLGGVLAQAEEAGISLETGSGSSSANADSRSEVSDSSVEVASNEITEDTQPQYDCEPITGYGTFVCPCPSRPGYRKDWRNFYNPELVKTFNCKY